MVQLSDLIVQISSLIKRIIFPVAAKGPGIGEKVESFHLFLALENKDFL
jgi:hypothetical protein